MRLFLAIMVVGLAIPLTIISIDVSNTLGVPCSHQFIIVSTVWTIILNRPLIRPTSSRKIYEFIKTSWIFLAVNKFLEAVVVLFEFSEFFDCATLCLFSVVARYVLRNLENGITKASKTPFTPDDMKPVNPDENAWSTQSINNHSLELSDSFDEEHIGQKKLINNKSLNHEKKEKRRLKKAKNLSKKNKTNGTEELTTPDADDTPFTLVTSKKLSDKLQPAEPCYIAKKEKSYRDKLVIISKVPYHNSGIKQDWEIVNFIKNLLFFQKIARQYSFPAPVTYHRIPNGCLMKLEFESVKEATTFRTGFSKTISIDQKLKAMRPTPFARRDFNLEEMKVFENSHKFVCKENEKVGYTKYVLKDVNYELNPVFLKIKEATVTNNIVATMNPALPTSSPTTSVSTSSTFPKIEILRNEEYHTALSSMTSASSEPQHFQNADQSAADLNSVATNEKSHFMDPPLVEMSSEGVMESEDVSQMICEESTFIPSDEERKKRVMMTKAPFTRIGMTDPKGILLFLQKIAVQHYLGVPLYVRYYRTLLSLQFNSSRDADSFRFKFSGISYKDPVLQMMNPKPEVRRDFSLEEMQTFRNSRKFVTQENMKAGYKKYILKDTHPELSWEYYNGEGKSRVPEFLPQDAPPQEIFHSMQPVPLFQPVMGNPYAMVNMTNNTSGPVNQILLTNNTAPLYGWFNYGNNTMMLSTSSKQSQLPGHMRACGSAEDAASNLTNRGDGERRFQKPS
ncbi:hypothetical protein CRE_07748 [Caenorhabditis remanei]|uniref:Uncharacterized protein n=1 Tax=Caenorhabditis remanei TaxID=31234 RepID=E3N6R3_CAERE|nr:hypothetical protein CRE_07748 [Caenorhabditis remanei]